MGRIAVVDLAPAPAELGHGRRIAVRCDERKPVPLQHVADDLPDAAMADDDGVPFLAGWRHRGQLRPKRFGSQADEGRKACDLNAGD